MPFGMTGVLTQDTPIRSLAFLSIPAVIVLRWRQLTRLDPGGLGGL